MEESLFQEICGRLKTEHHYDLAGLVRPEHSPPKGRV